MGRDGEGRPGFIFLLLSNTLITNQPLFLANDQSNTALLVIKGRSLELKQKDIIMIMVMIMIILR